MGRRQGRTNPSGAPKMSGRASRYISTAVLLLFFIADTSCGASPKDGFNCSLTVSATGTAEEVTAALKKTSAVDLDQALKASLLAKGFKQKDIDSLNIHLTVAQKKAFAGDPDWLSMGVTYKAPSKVSGHIRRANRADKEYDEPLYYGCRSLADQFFGRPTVSLELCPRGQKIECYPGKNALPMDDVLARLGRDLENFVREAKPEQKASLGNIGVVLIPGDEIDLVNVLDISYPEGCEPAVRELETIFLKALDSSGWKGEIQ